MMKTTQPSLGGDPEFFIFLKKQKKYQVISADKILPPKTKKLNTPGGDVFFDGVQAEINPSFNTCRERLLTKMYYCIDSVYDLAREKYSKDKVVFAPLASIPITKKDIEGADKECIRFGCSPDSNIYSDEAFEYPDGSKFMTRFSGGHIHLGFADISYMNKFKDPDKMFNLIRALDCIAGIMSTALSQGEEERIRRKYYGRAGTYRLQPHGLEYRPLSSFWLVSPQMASLMLALVRDAFTLTYYDKEKLLFDVLSKDEVRRIIDKHDINSAVRVYNDVLKPLYDKEFLHKRVPLNHQYVRDLVDEMVKKGYKRIFNPYNMLNYWCIKKPYLEPDWNERYGMRKLSMDVKYKFKNIEDIRKLGD